MKKTTHFKKAGLFALVATVPISLWAVSDSMGHFWDGVNIGSNSWNATTSSNSAPEDFLMVGLYNSADNRYRVGLVGRSLIAPCDDSLVVGDFNDPTGSSSTSVFTVANGSSATLPKNLFEVRRNGDVIITEPQGDIPMGIYGTN
jgi:hypothetical protein